MNNFKSDPFCQIGQVCDHRRIKFTLPKKTSGLQKLETFKIDKHARRMCLFADAIWLPCFIDNCILVYSQDGVLLQTVQNVKIQRPHVVEEFSDTHLMVGAENGLFLLQDPPRGLGQTLVRDTDSHGHMLQQVREGCFCDVSIESPNMAALDFKEAKVNLIKYKKSWGRITEVATVFKLDHETDYFDTVHLKGEHVYVASCVMHNVAKYTHKGVCLEKHGHHGNSLPGELDFPAFCNLFQQYAVVVADTLNNRLQSLDLDGDWQVLVDHGVKRPADAVLGTNNRVFILSGRLNDYKIHNFEIIVNVDDNKGAD